MLVDALNSSGNVMSAHTICVVWFFWLIGKTFCLNFVWDILVKPILPLWSAFKSVATIWIVLAQITARKKCYQRDAGSGSMRPQKNDSALTGKMQFKLEFWQHELETAGRSTLLYPHWMCHCHRVRLLFITSCPASQATTCAIIRMFLWLTL